MLDKLEKKVKIRLVVAFIFLIIVDIIFFTIFENNRPIYINMIGSIFTSIVIIFGLAIFFNKYKNAE